MNYSKYPTRAWQSMLTTFANQNNGGLGASATNLYIMGGQLPSDADIKTMTNGYITQTRASDILITYSVDGRIATANSKLTVYDTAYKVPTNSGNATWFALASGGWYIIVGDVSDTNGTGVLRLNNTAIVAGAVYKVFGFSFDFPYEFPIA